MGDAPKVAAPCHFAGIGGQKTALCAVSDSQQAPGRAQPAADLLEMNTGLNRTRGRKAASFGAGAGGFDAGKTIHIHYYMYI